jgi:hypothetical protein
VYPNEYINTYNGRVMVILTWRDSETWSPKPLINRGGLLLLDTILHAVVGEEVWVRLRA